MSIIETAIQRARRAERAGAKEGANAPASPGVATASAPGSAVPRAAPVTWPGAEFHGAEVDFSVERLFSAGLAPPAERRRRLLHEYRVVRRSLLESLAANAAGVGDGANRVMVTSAFAREGKTFTSVNLSLCLVLERAREVVLIDADLPRRDLSVRLGLGEDPGLVDLLKNPSLEIGSTVRRTSVPGLFFLPAGEPDELANELLGSDAMKAIARQLAAPGRILLFDSAPLLMTSESATLSDVVGQVVLVVRAGSTPRYAVAAAVEQLSDNKPVAALLNGFESFGPHGGYYGYYGGYGSYGG